MRDEDHTLGNLVRYFCSKNKSTTFCGYSCPHPSEPVVKVRLQTSGEQSALDTVMESFETLCGTVDVISDAFSAAVAGFDAELTDDDVDSKMDVE
jgi:DNA-directed RNA polymerase I and III subunit RPAC2